MPITFSIEQKVVRTEARGIVTYSEILDHIEAKIAAGAMAFPEIFDARDVMLDLSSSDLQQIASKVVDALAGAAPGKIAVVTNSPFLFGLARSYGELTKETNPQFKVTCDPEEADSWIVTEL